MIGRLRGSLVARKLDSITVEVGGVGYVVAVTPRTIADLPGLGDEVVLHTHLHVREDQLSLFGFPTERELDTFALLLGASGVGPRMALAMLATLSPEQLVEALVGEDIGALSTVPGIGRRTAQKLILELKPRFAGVSVALVGSGVARGQVREALEGLGYQPTEITEVLADVGADLGVEDQLREALRSLGRRRMQ